LLNHIEAIPRDSAFTRKRLGVEAAEWDNKTELAAASVDMLQVVVRTLQQAHFQNAPSDELKPVPRPWQVDEPVKPAVGLSSLPDFLKGTL
jgi:hypothetical protein